MKRPQRSTTRRHSRLNARPMVRRLWPPRLPAWSCSPSTCNQPSIAMRRACSAYWRRWGPNQRRGRQRIDRLGRRRRGPRLRRAAVLATPRHCNPDGARATSPADAALALACALGELCERSGDDTEFAAIRAQVAAVETQPDASAFWRGHWAIVSAGICCRSATRATLCSACWPRRRWPKSIA